MLSQHDPGRHASSLGLFQSVDRSRSGWEFAGVFQPNVDDSLAADTLRYDVAAFHQRLFADDYAAGGQLSWLPDANAPLVATGDEEPWRLAYLGALRFDSLLSRRLVVPDSHLLDGRFFLSAQAGDLRQELGRPTHGFTDGQLRLPIVFGLRRATLRETISEFLRTDRESLNGFSFKSLPEPDARRQLAVELKNRTWTELERRLNADANPAIAVGGLIRDCLEVVGFGLRADEWVGPLEQRWSSWLELESQGALEVEQYGWGTFDLVLALKDEGVSQDEFSTEVGRSGLRAIQMLVQNDKKLRTHANETMDQLRLGAVDDPVATADLRRLDHLYSRVRYRAIARQHDATFIRTRKDGLALGAGERLLERVESDFEESVGRRIELPEDVTQSMGELPPEEFRRFLALSSKQLGEWWNTGELTYLQEAVENLADVLASPRKLPSAWLLVLINGAVTASAAVLASPLHVPAALTAGGAVITGAAGTLAAEHKANAPTRDVRRRIADAVADLDQPILTGRLH